MRCPACRRPVPGRFPACPGCKASLIAPALAGGDGGPDPATLAPTIFEGERLGPGADLARAIAEAPAGATLTLAPGEFRLGALAVLALDLTIAGAGAGLTRIVSTAADAAIQVVHGARLELIGVTLAHEGRKAADVMVVLDGEAEIADCVLSGGYTAAFVREPSGEGRHGRGLVVMGASGASAHRTAFTHNVRDGVAVLGDAAFHGEAITCRQNQGAGFLAAGRAHAMLAGGACEVNFLGGIVLRDDARAIVQDVACRRGPTGMALFHRAEAGIAGCVFEGNQRADLVFHHQSGGVVRDDVRTAAPIDVRDQARPQLGPSTRRIPS